VEIALLRTFIEVARTRHFGKAAEHLCVTQSAVSARVKLLETTLGVELFNRRRNDIQLTPAGHRLLRYAETIVRGWERARHELALDERFGRSLAVGCQLDLWPIRVRDWAAGLRGSHANLALQIEILPADALVRRLASDLRELVFLFEPPSIQELEMEQVARIRLVLVADRPDLSAEEATGQGYILVDWGTPFMMAHSAHYPELPPPSLRLSQGLMALDLLRRVGGAAYLPRELVGQSIEAGELFEVADAPAIERFAYAAFRPGAGNRDLVTDALTGLRGGADG
jgi:DNA-binding transcriptional LysR family regulator